MDAIPRCPGRYTRYCLRPPGAGVLGHDGCFSAACSRCGQMEPPSRGVRRRFVLHFAKDSRLRIGVRSAVSEPVAGCIHNLPQKWLSWDLQNRSPSVL